MRIVVLVKPVPDTASGGERLRPADWRLDRAAIAAVVNANDEYALEAALKLTEAHGGEVVLVAMSGPGAPDTMRKALAMGAASGTLVTDDALAGSDAVKAAGGPILDKRKVELSAPIKTLGTHEVVVRVTGDVSAKVAIEVVSA